MKIAIVSLQFEATSTGGGGVHVENIAKQFLSLGQDVTVVSIHTNKTLKDGLVFCSEKNKYSVEARGNLKIMRFLVDKDIEQPYVGDKDTELDRIMRFAKVVIAWVKENEAAFDVISLQGHHIIPGFMAKELQGIRPKTVSYLHALETTYVTKKGDFVGAYNGTKEILSRIREWEAMARFADVVLGNSPIVNEEFKHIIGEYEKEPEKFYDKIKLIVSGCDADFLMSDNEVKNKLSKKPEVIKLVTFCRIDPSKGIHYSITGAIEAAKLSDKKFCLTIAGIPASEEYIEELKVLAINVPDNLEVIFKLFTAISAINEKKEVLDNQHLYILPTLKEPFGMSLIEASARGNMIVSADTNGPQYIFESDKGKEQKWGISTDRGVLAKITDDHDKYFSRNIGQAIAWTVEDWEESVLRVLNLNKKIKDTWTWESIGQEYLELFKRLV